jgi:hypothetical protein
MWNRLRRMPKPEAAILGCTHYPLVEEVFREALGPDVAVYSQPDLVAEALADYLDRRPEDGGAGGESRFLTTGDPGAFPPRRRSSCAEDRLRGRRGLIPLWKKLGSLGRENAVFETNIVSEQTCGG